MAEVNVIAILILGVCNFVIDLAIPYNSYSWVMSLIYLLEVALFLFLDAVRHKHRAFVLAVGVLFGCLNVYNACELIFGDYYVGKFCSNIVKSMFFIEGQCNVQYLSKYLCLV